MIDFPPHPFHVPWPTMVWPAGGLADDVDGHAVHEALEAIHQTPDDQGITLATLAVHRGRLVVEQYGPDITRETTLISWSMAKSVTATVFGMLVGDGLIDIGAPAPVPEFAGTAKAAITIAQLLAMRSGLEFVEDYVDDSISHCLEMLFGQGVADHAHYAASLPLLHEPGSVWNYSSGTTNILARIAGDLVAEGADGSHEADMRAYLQQRLFDPIGMTSAAPKFDDAGTFVGSSYVYATAQDFARFGYLYLRDGVWDGARILPEGWANYSREVQSISDEPPHFGYGAQWWIWRDQPGSLAAHGYEGQYIIVVPARDLVLVHLGKVPADVRPALFAKLGLLINAFPT